MTKHLTSNVAVTGPRGPVVLLAGTVPPEWAEDQIGGHLLAENDQKQTPTARKQASGNRKAATKEQDTAGKDLDDEADDDKDTQGDEAPDFTGPAPRTRRTGKKP